MPARSLPLVNISLLSTTVSLFSACFTARESFLAVQKELRSYSSQRWPLARRVQNKSSAPSAEGTGSLQVAAVISRCSRLKYPKQLGKRKTQQAALILQLRASASSSCECQMKSNCRGAKSGSLAQCAFLTVNKCAPKCVQHTGYTTGHVAAEIAR